MTPPETPAPGSPQPDSDSAMGTTSWTRKQDETQSALLKIMADEHDALIPRMVEIFRE